ncbi:MAG: hypothetical protein WAO20_03135 [Acidobacteriota bacterium]
MTGRIEKLATSETPGRIATNSGPTQFHFTYRQTMETSEGLAVGQLVSFQLEKGTTEFAVGVRPEEAVGSLAGNGNKACQIRYQGFEQTSNVRFFKFQVWRSGEENQEAVVTADLALFRKHDIGIQEGPGICLRLLKAEFQESDAIDGAAWTRAVCDKDMLAYLSIEATTKGSRRKRSRY